VLDGDWLFGTLLELSRLRAAFGELAEIIVVGIGYPPGTSFVEWGTRRTYEFSTSEWELESAVGRWLTELYEGYGQKLRLGGAADLLGFIVDELRPVVRRLYPVDTADEAIFGFSAAGNFVGQALFDRPGAFAKYLAASPAFVYNDWDVFARESAYAESHHDLPATVYLGCGGGEALQLSILEIASGTAKLAETLRQRAYPSLRLVCEFFTGKTHNSGYTESMQRALEISWGSAA
jgi:predicted alpha/beta superfamily hydrolase